MSVSRRVTLGWIAAASSTTALLGCDSQAPKAPKVGRWEDVALQPLTAPGYGQDPNLVDPMARRRTRGARPLVRIAVSGLQSTRASRAFW